MPSGERVRKRLDARLDWLQSLGEVPAVNPRRGKLPGVVATPDRTVVAALWGLATLAVLVAASIVTVVFGDRIGGFIYANF